ncbi:MAG: DUF4157 domain-containing protein [Myxococcales bacterium]|nr:DUF4157 domain-containing protein [Myxococcales bacterium]
MSTHYLRERESAEPRAMDRSAPPSTAPEARSSNCGQATRAGDVCAQRALQFKRAKPEEAPSAGDLRVAEAGVRGGGGALPAGDRIGSSLGADLSGVRAHTGPDAKAACDTLGAEAYTVGSNIAFRDSNPSLSLQAHEAAHTVQQGASPTVDKKSEGAIGTGDRERAADDAAERVVAGERATVEPSPAPPLQRFAPVGHEEATAEGLKGSFSAAEIGLIYQSNWERDFSQGSAKIADAVIAWKAVKQSAAKSGSPSKEAGDQFKGAAWGVVNMGATEVTDESLSGYQPWEHMDNPGASAGTDADKRWGKKKGQLAGHICDAKAYIKDMLVKAVDAQRTSAGLGKAGEGIDNWDGVKKPDGYGAAKEVADPGLSRAPVAQDARDRATAAGAKDGGPAGAGFSKAAEPLGRATHSMEDFFSHGNFLELAKEMKKTNTTPNAPLKTATFTMPDKCHALGHKILSLAEGFLRDFGLLQKVYDRTEGKAKTKAKSRYKGAAGSLNTDSWTPQGEMVDILPASQDIEEAVQGGKVDLGDFLVDRAFLEALKKKGETLMAEGEKETDAGGHAKLAKDAPEPGKDCEGAIRLAIEANRLVVAPLKAVMQIADVDAAKVKLVEQLALVDRMIAPPDPSHPLMPFVGE